MNLAALLFDLRILFCFTSGYFCFQQNTIKEKMEMTTPVVTRKVQSGGEKMEMTTPVITRKVNVYHQWIME